MESRRCHAEARTDHCDPARLPWLPEELATRRCPGRDHGRRLPGSPGHGLRGRGRSSPGRRSVGRLAGHAPLRPERYLTPAVRRTGVDHRPHDRRGHRATRSRRPHALRSARGSPGPRCRPALFDRMGHPARLPGRPPLQARARRLPGRCRLHHDRGPAAPPHRDQRQRIGVLPPALLVPPPHRRPALAHDRNGRGLPAPAVHPASAVAGSARPPRCPRSRHGGGDGLHAGRGAGNRCHRHGPDRLAGFRPAPTR